MLHHLFIIKKETGISLGKIDFTGKYSEAEADYISAGIKAIQDFFNGIKFGELESFQFQDKSVIISANEEITFILVCSKDSDLRMYRQKLDLISVMYEENIDWCKWYGDVGIFRNLLNTTKELLVD